jgi:multisubunit Na+/H+ antiporter MnhG subunit
MELSNNDLRAIAGIILLILAIVLMFSTHESDAVNYVVLALAGFLVGGSLFNRDQTSK